MQNWPIRTKLLVALLGPLLVLAVLALVGIRHNQAESERAERSLSASYIDSGRTQWGAQLVRQRQTVDRVAGAYRAGARQLSADDRILEEKIDYGLSELGRLPEQRRAIDTAKIDPEELKVEPGIELHEEEGE